MRFCIFMQTQWTPKANGKTVTPINITSKISKGILVVVFSRCIRGTGHCGLSLLHTSDISIGTTSIRKQSMTSLRLAKIKKEFFFVSSFVRLFAYAWTMILCLRRSLCRRLDFIPLFCLLFCLYAYAHVWTVLYDSSLIITICPGDSCNRMGYMSSTC